MKGIITVLCKYNASCKYMLFTIPKKTERLVPTNDDDDEDDTRYF